LEVDRCKAQLRAMHVTKVLAMAIPRMICTRTLTTCVVSQILLEVNGQVGAKT
jgi:hypothetical protein